MLATTQIQNINKHSFVLSQDLNGRAGLPSNYDGRIVEVKTEIKWLV